MRAEYIPPKLHERGFHCPHCGVYANQEWFDLDYYYGGSNRPTPMKVARCARCTKLSYWFEERMVEPPLVPVEPPHIDLPDDCRPEYEEAMRVFGGSPRAAAALLRLCIQKLMPHLGGQGRNINEDIKGLVQKGLPVLVQKALDVARVVGNNAVHPGEIDLNDTPGTAQALFGVINYIVEDRIARPREIEALYNSLPEGARAAIGKRDGTVGDVDAVRE
jgi:hypothetical protein